MKLRSIVLMLTVALFTIAATAQEKVKTNDKDMGMKVKSKGMMHSPGAMKLRTDMRKLWEDHITWTRNVIFNIIDDLPGLDQDLSRLMKNQEDIGNAIKHIYGDAAGNKLTELLKAHISISGDILKALKADDNGSVNAASKHWNDNADEISAFLSKANPNWPLNDMKTMMHDHLKFTTDEAVARKSKDYVADVTAYDKVHEEILRMADMLSDGIIKQYPDKFK
jgi:hypothetical protein